MYRYNVSFSIQGDDLAAEVAKQWPMLVRRQSSIEYRLHADRRWTNFDGVVEDLELLVRNVAPRMKSEYATFSFSPIVEAQ